MCTVVSTYISHRILKLDLSKVELIPFISHLGLLSFCIHCLVSATASVYASKLKPRVNLSSHNPIIKSVIFCLQNSSQIKSFSLQFYFCCFRILLFHLNSYTSLLFLSTLLCHAGCCQNYLCKKEKSDSVILPIKSLPWFLLTRWIKRRSLTWHTGPGL